jgi:hypothetical protein
MAKLTRLSPEHFEIDKQQIGFATVAPFAHPFNLATTIDKHPRLDGSGANAFFSDRLKAHGTAIIKPAEENKVEIFGRFIIPISKAADDLVSKRLPGRRSASLSIL